MDHGGRQNKLKAAFARQGLDALLVTHPPNIQYLCGFTGSAGALLITAGKTIFFTDGRYTGQAREEVEAAKVVIARKAPQSAAAEWLVHNANKLQLKNLGIEGDHLTVAERSRLAKNLPSGLRLKAAPPLVEQARMVKDQDELEKIRTAVVLGASLFDVALSTIRPGVKEVEVAAEMEYAARCAGAEGMSFETIIASGPRSALPHGRASQAEVPAKGFVVCDFGVILSGYCSDMTRTVHVGRPSTEGRRIYEAVHEAQAAACAAVASGVAVGKIDDAARKLLHGKGLSKYFTHSTGHGVGLEIHERPRIASAQKERLSAGMVITIEPGVYIPDCGGVRIEDMVVVTEGGCEVLTPTTKELIVI